jgi:hypothetical protein
VVVSVTLFWSSLLIFPVAFIIMQNYLRLLIALGFLCTSQLLSTALMPTLVQAAEPLPAADPSAPEPTQSALHSTGDRVSSRAVERLSQMFSPQIQATINACQTRGKVNVIAGATPEGSVVCGDGSPEATVAYDNYIETVSDILAASSLVGFRAVLQADPRLTPELLRTAFSSPEGVQILRSAIQVAITQSDFLPATATESTTILTDSVLERLRASLQDSSTLNTLLGTPDQYSSVVNQFCLAPGMSVEQAKTAVPELNSLQLYAICIQESGVASEVLRTGQ